MRKKLLILLITAMLFLAACGKEPSGNYYSDYSLDTIVSLTIYDAHYNQKLIDGYFKIIRNYDDMWNVSKPESDIYKINHSHGNPVTVNEETALLLNDYLKISNKTDYVINPLIGCVTGLWDFYQQKVPSEEAVKKALQYLDPSNISIDGNTVTLKDNCKVDIGCIAKGYIADKLFDYLIENEVQSAIINLGGNIKTLGTKLNGKPYTIAIDDPESSDGYSKLLYVSNSSVVTSGIYQRSFTLDDVFYHHILNPETGYPVDNDIYTTTVVYENSQIADAMSTALFILGPDKASSIVKSYPGMKVIYVMKDRSILEVE